jgi:hypothetical protein
VVLAALHEPSAAQKPSHASMTEPGANAVV